MPQLENREIKEIPDVPPLVLDAAKRGKLVVFIGAGVSRIWGCPSWDEFAHKRLKDLRERNVINYHEYIYLKKLDARKILSIYKNLCKEKGVRELPIKNLFVADKEKRSKYPTLYENLFNFNAAYVTTNYDEFLDLVVENPPSPVITIGGGPPQSDRIDRDVRKGRVFYKNEDLLISNIDIGNVIHVHGSVRDETNVIITIDEYMKHYEKSDRNPNSRARTFLEEIFNNYTVLFVGYGLEEYELLEFMVSKSQVDDKEIKHFRLFPVFNAEINILHLHRKYYQELGIGLIEYPLDVNGYEHLTKVIEKWADFVGSKAKPQGFYDRIKLFDEEVR